MAAPTGLEPATSGLTGRRSDQTELRHHGCAYPECDSNAHCPRPERGASCRLGYPGMSPAALQPAAAGGAAATTPLWGRVCGPTRSRTGHARLARRRCTPVLSPESQRGDSNSLPRRYEGRAHPDVLRWHGASDGSRTRTGRLQGGCTTVVRRWRSRTPGRIRTGTVRPLRPLPLPLGYEGMFSQGPLPARRQLRVHRVSTRLRALPVAPRQGFEPRFPDSESGVLPVGRSGKGPAGEPRRRPSQRWTRAAHVGACGVVRSGIRAWAGVRSPLR